MAEDAAIRPATPLLIRITTRSGAVRVEAAEAGRLTVEGGRLLAVSATEYEVQPQTPSNRVTVRCPAGCDLIVGTTSGAIETSGVLGNVRATTGSGAVKIEEALCCDVRVASGRSEIGRCGTARVSAMNGAVHVGEAESAEISTANGRVEVGSAGHLRVRAANGAVKAEIRGDSQIETISGRVDVSVPGGLRPSVRSRTLAGRTENHCPPGEDLKLSIQTVRGDIDVRPA